MDQETLAFFIGTFTLFTLLCLLFLGAQWQILTLLYRPLPPPDPPEEDLHNDPTMKVQAMP